MKRRKEESFENLDPDIVAGVLAGETSKSSPELVNLIVEEAGRHTAFFSHSGADPYIEAAKLMMNPEDREKVEQVEQEGARNYRIGQVFLKQLKRD